MASGNGSNFQALIDAVASNTIPNSKIIRLVVNRAKAYATTRADKAGIPWEYFNLIQGGFLAKGEKDEKIVAAAREKYDAALAQKVLNGAERPDLIVLAGWMHVFSGAFLAPLEKEGCRVINLHPALPGRFFLFALLHDMLTRPAGAFDGAGAIERAFHEFKAGTLTKTGIMVHYVIEAVDRGDPIMVQEIEWQGEELPELEARIHSYEHDLIVKATAKVATEIVEKRSK
jgi:phosphoribosylglycinamide formyltransferase